MSLPRFFVTPDQLETDTQGTVTRARITEDEALHAARVLRLVVDDRVVICDGSGLEYLGVLRQVSVAECLAEIIAERYGPAEPRVQLHLFAGLSKGDRMDYLIQKCTELGVTAIHPVFTERTVVRLEGSKAAARTQRWQRIAREAAKQCGRARYPSVSMVEPLEEAVSRHPCRPLIVAWEEATEPLRSWLDRPHPVSEIGWGAVIGPEGGLSSEEVECLIERGAVVGGGGPRSLRTETAGVVLVTLIAHALGELDRVAKDGDGGWSCV